MKRKFLCILLLLACLLPAGCGGGSAEFEAMPLTPSRLYLYDRALNAAYPASGDIIDMVAFQSSAQAMSMDWTFTMSNQVLKPTAGYCIYMATDTNRQVQVEFLLKSGVAPEVSLGKDASARSSNRWQLLCGEVALTPVATQQGDQLILRVSVETDRWMLFFGPSWASWVEVFDGTPTVSEAKMDLRNQALGWFAKNAREYDPHGLSFENFRGQVDYIITSGGEGIWTLGDQFARSGSPYRLTLNAGGFQAEKISLDDISENLQDTDDISFSIHP